MRVHANAKLGPAGRLALVQRIGEGESLRTAARGSSVSVATAHRWWHRWLEADAAQRASGVWLADRSSRPHRQPRRTSAELEARICAVRQATGWGPRLVAGATGQPHSTVWRVLSRHGLSRRPRSERGAPNRYEWPCPGDLLHMDVCAYPRFRRPGHRATGDRSQRDRHWMRPETRVGNDYAHAIIDDHSRLAYVELHDDQRAATVTAFMQRALAFFAGHGITTRRRHDRQRVHLHQEPLAARAAHRPRHPPPHHPALPTAHQRQGRTLPPNHGPRMGPRPQLPHQPGAEPASWETGSITTTTGDRTQPSATGHPSPAFTTSQGRTASSA